MGPGELDRVAEFWAWWAGARPRFEGGEAAAVRDELAARVAAIHEKLAWEIGGAPGMWQLVVSPEGNPALRRLTARWAAAAPRDAGWEYLPARPRRAELDFSVGIDGRRIALGEARFATRADETRGRVHVTVYHRGFAGASEELRAFAAILVLDNVLGEDDVERWIGHIGTEPSRPWLGVVKAGGLRAAVDALAAARKAQAWAILKMQNDEGKLGVAAIDFALRRLDFLDHDQHLEVVHGDVEARDEIEQALVAAVGEHAVHYGHMIAEGKVAVFFYAPARRPVESAIAGLVARHGLTTEWTEDPGWERLARY